MRGAALTSPFTRVQVAYQNVERLSFDRRVSRDTVENSGPDNSAGTVQEVECSTAEPQTRGALFAFYPGDRELHELRGVSNVQLFLDS